MHKPNFLIVGAAKSGTTALANYLGQHPDVFVSQVKEPRYFARDVIAQTSRNDPLYQSLADTSILDSEAYYQLFAGAGCKKFRGEASVHYLYHYQSVIPKIKAELGEVKIVIIIRQPVQRAISNFFYLRSEGDSFAEALAQEPQRQKEGYNSFWYHRQLGFYHHQIQAYRENFKDVKILLYDDFRQDPQVVYDDLCIFLGLPTAQLVDNGQEVNVTTVPKSAPVKWLLSLDQRFDLPRRVVNKVAGNSIQALKKKLFIRPNYRDIETGLYNELLDGYLADINKLEAELQLDLSAWKKRRGAT